MHEYCTSSEKHGLLRWLDLDASAAAFSSGMHAAALRVPELLELILTSFSDPKAKDLLNCALVSRYWADIAIPILWKAPQLEEPWIDSRRIVATLGSIVESELNVGICTSLSVGVV
jgi:hypothetical protein